MTIEDRARRIGDRILLIVPFGKYGIEGGNRTAAADTVARAFNQRRQFGEKRWRIAIGSRWLADRQRDFTLRHRIASERIHDQQHVLAAIAKIFGDAGGVSGALHAQQRRYVRRGGDHH